LAHKCDAPVCGLSGYARLFLAALRLCGGIGGRRAHPDRRQIARRRTQRRAVTGRQCARMGDSDSA
jgi:hypothetical protein